MKLATANDIPPLLDLMAEFYAESGYTLDREQAAAGFATLVKDDGLGSVWLNESAAGVAGYVVLTDCFSMEYGGLVGFVDDFFVRPASRGGGLGSSMLQELREHAAARGLRALFVEVAPENSAAQQVYRRAGFFDTHRQLLSLPLAPPSHLVD